MAETLGSLCDKLTIVRLKQWHSSDRDRLESLAHQLGSLKAEIDAFVANAVARKIPLSQLQFDANKVYRNAHHAPADFAGGLGCMVSQLAEVNCALWHQQEKIYDFARVPAAAKNSTVKRLAALNLERNQFIERIDELFREKIIALHSKPVRRATAKGCTRKT